MKKFLKRMPVLGGFLCKLRKHLSYKCDAPIAGEGFKGRSRETSGDEGAGHALALSPSMILPILDRHGVQPWFKYIFSSRSTRWDIWEPCQWISQHCAQDEHVLETACGVGFNLMWLAGRGFKNLYGFDIDQRAIAAGNEIATKQGLVLRLWVDDGLCPKHLPRDRFSAVIALNWTMLLAGFKLEDFFDKYLPCLTEGGVLIIDAIDTAYNSIPNNQYLTSDWEKPEDQRQPSEYKFRASKEDVARIAEARGLEVAVCFRRPQMVQKSVFVIRRKSACTSV